MANFLNFKKVEVTGSTKEEALASAGFNTIMKDATQAFKNAKKAHSGAWTEADTKQFMLDYTAKYHNAPGVGFSITVEPAVADTRERPYRVENIKREGTTNVRTTFVWRDLEDGHDVLKIVSTSEKRATKADAFQAIKDLICSGEYHGKCKLYTTKEEETPVAIGYAEYAPSKSSRVGTYLVFGIEA